MSRPGIMTVTVTARAAVRHGPAAALGCGDAATQAEHPGPPGRPGAGLESAYSLAA